MRVSELGKELGKSMFWSGLFLRLFPHRNKPTYYYFARVLRSFLVMITHMGVNEGGQSLVDCFFVFGAKAAAFAKKDPPSGVCLSAGFASVGYGPYRTW